MGGINFMAVREEAISVVKKILNIYPFFDKFINNEDFEHHIGVYRFKFAMTK